MCCVQDVVCQTLYIYIYKGNESFPELQEGVLDLHVYVYNTLHKKYIIILYYSNTLMDIICFIYEQC